MEVVGVGDVAVPPVMGPGGLHHVVWPGTARPGRAALWSGRSLPPGHGRPSLVVGGSS